MIRYCREEIWSNRVWRIWRKIGRRIARCWCLSPRLGLRWLGITVPDRPTHRPLEHELYKRLHERLGAGAHSYYNSLIRRVVSYARGLERKQSRAD